MNNDLKKIESMIIQFNGNSGKQLNFLHLNFSRNVIPSVTVVINGITQQNVGKKKQCKSDQIKIHTYGT